MTASKNGPVRRAAPAPGSTGQKKIETKFEAAGGAAARKSGPDSRRKSDLARIHILKAELKLTRDQYEAVLLACGSVESSALLDSHGRAEVIKQLEYRRSQAAPAAEKTYPGRPKNADAKHRAELLKIEALLTDAGRPWAYAEAMAQRMYKRARLEFCHEGHLAGIITALEKDALKRLHREMAETFGEAWGQHASFYARVLFRFDSIHRDVTCYTQPLSLVLRWWRGSVEASCVWPVLPDTRSDSLCGGCDGRYMHRAGLAAE